MRLLCLSCGISLVPCNFKILRAAPAWQLFRLPSRASGLVLSNMRQQIVELPQHTAMAAGVEAFSAMRGRPGCGQAWLALRHPMRRHMLQIQIAVFSLQVILQQELQTQSAYSQ